MTDFGEDCLGSRESQVYTMLISNHEKKHNLFVMFISRIIAMVTDKEQYLNNQRFRIIITTSTNYCNYFNN